MAEVTNPLRIGVLAFDGCFASEVFGVTDLLTMTNHVLAHTERRGPAFETCVVSPRRRVRAAGGFGLDVEPLREVDVLLVPGFDIAAQHDLETTLARLRPEVEALRDAAAAGTPVVAICVGAFLLGEAGLLSGRSATTSWLFAGRLAARHPDVDLRTEQLVVTDAGVTTTAAFSAMFDFVLDLVDQRCGRDAARRTARIALVDDARTSQTPYVDHELLPAGGSGFAKDVQRHLDRRLRERYDLGALASAFHVSERTLLRRFKAETGATPLAYLQASRMRRARHLLETTDLSVAEIHAAVGYRDAGAFADLFARHIGLRPGAYRRAFRRSGEMRAG